LNEEITNAEKIKKVTGGTEKAIVTTDATSPLKEVVKSATDEQIKSAFASAMNDPDFATMVKEEFADRLKESQDDTMSDSEALEKLKLSPEEARQALYNGNNKFIKFCMGDAKLAAEVMKPEQSKK